MYVFLSLVLQLPSSNSSPSVFQRIKYICEECIIKEQAEEMSVLQPQQSCLSCGTGYIINVERHIGKLNINEFFFVSEQKTKGGF